MREKSRRGQERREYGRGEEKDALVYIEGAFLCYIKVLFVS